MVQHKAVRKFLATAVSLYLAIATCSAQQSSETSSHKPGVGSLLAKLRSDEGVDRDAAFYQLRSNPAVMRNQKVRSALLELLDRETKEGDEGKHAGEGEGYGEYFSDLLGAVENFANWEDQRQVCILVHAGATPDSPVAEEARSRMRVAVPCLLEMSKGPRRVIAIPILVQALAKVKDDLDATTIQTSQTAISLALHDSDEGVRFFTVDALGKFGGKDMIPALREIVVKDPSPKSQGDSIRRSAAEAIAAIERRTGQQQ